MKEKFPPTQWNIEGGEDFVTFQPLLVLHVKLGEYGLHHQSSPSFKNPSIKQPGLGLMSIVRKNWQQQQMCNFLQCCGSRSFCRIWNIYHWSRSVRRKLPVLRTIKIIFGVQIFRQMTNKLASRDSLTSNLF
jgi:hypothetical protein